MNSTNNTKTQTTKTILIILAIIVITLAYFTLMYIVFKPNVLTWWSDEYEYVSQARNFALFSKLETSFYSARAVLYGNFPSFGYHPILYSFLAGLFLKIFGAIPKATFAFNYILSLLTLLIMYFYSKERIGKKDIAYPLILIAIFPVFIIYTNTQSPEIFFICIVSLIYYIFFKNSSKFNISHFIILMLLAAISCQRFTYLVLALVLLIYTYIIWLKGKKIIHFFISIIFFSGLYYLLWWIFGSNLQVYPATHEGSIYFHLKNYGLICLASKETWFLFYSYIKHTTNNLLNIFITPNSNYFLFHWLFTAIILCNIFILFKTKDKTIKKELSLILIPELLLIIASITSYPPTDLEHFSHLRPLLGFLPLNLFYIYIFIKKIKLRVRIVFLIVFIPLILASSFYVYKPFYTKKIENASYLNIHKIKLISDTMEKYRYKDSLTIAGIDSPEAPIRDYIVFSNNRDKFIRTNQFLLNEEEINQFSQKPYIDIWLIKENNYFIKHHLYKWPFSIDINLDDIIWKLYIEENAFPKKVFYILEKNNLSEEWKPLNNCKFIIENNEITINATGDDPCFENISPFNFKDNLNYYIEIILISPEPSYLQVFYRNEGGNYNEKGSNKLLTVKGENIFITKIYGNMIRIDPGTMSGKYIIKKIYIYFSDY